MLAPPLYCLAGAAPDTRNLGVSALCHSVVEAFGSTEPGADWVVFDNGRGLREEQWNNGLSVTRCGARDGKRLYRSDNFTHIRVMSAIAPSLNPAARIINRSDAFMDISGGDSFTDIYGMSRFNKVVQAKNLALRLNKPLLLLPQTYGPFKTQEARDTAAMLIRNSVGAWARDPDSFDVLKDVIGPDFDPDKHRQGVDVAFRLPMAAPPDEVLQPIRGWLESPQDQRVGINISGLLYNQAESGKEQFGFKADYRTMVHTLLQQLIDTTDANIMLIPHVVSDNFESDVAACEAVRDAMKCDDPERLSVAPTLDQPEHTKWVLSHAGWFCGTRMHSCILAISSCVPTAAVAYSPKTLGVFKTCGQPDSVFDPTQLDTQPMIDGLLAHYQNRHARVDQLKQSIPRVIDIAHQQISEMRKLIHNN